MAIIDVVKWEDNQKEFCHKFPSEDLRVGSQLVVNTAQTAIFVKGGQILDEFTAGTYTLKTENLPLLNKLISLPFGGKSRNDNPLDWLCCNRLYDHLTATREEVPS